MSVDSGLYVGKKLTSSLDFIFQNDSLFSCTGNVFCCIEPVNVLSSRVANTCIEGTE